MEQLCRHRREASRGVMGARDVLCMGRVQCLHHIDAEAGNLGEEHRELRHKGQGGSVSWFVGRLCSAQPAAQLENIWRLIRQTQAARDWAESSTVLAMLF